MTTVKRRNSLERTRDTIRKDSDSTEEEKYDEREREQHTTTSRRKYPKPEAYQDTSLDYEEFMERHQDGQERRYRKLNVKVSTGKDENGLLTSKLVTVILILLCLVGLVFVVFNNNQQNEKGKGVRYENFKETIRKMESKFSDQPELTWKVVRSSVKDMFGRQGSGRPKLGVLLLLSTKNDEKLRECFAKRIAEAMTSSLEGANDHVPLDGRELSRKSPNDAKLKIERDVESRYNSSQSVVVYFKDLDKLPVSSAMIFHGLCDDTNPTFDNAAYIFTATVDSSNIDWKNGVSSKAFDNFAYKHFTELWEKDLEDEKLQALFSRLFPSVAVLRPINSFYSCP